MLNCKGFIFYILILSLCVLIINYYLETRFSSLGSCLGVLGSSGEELFQHLREEDRLEALERFQELLIKKSQWDLAERYW